MATPQWHAFMHPVLHNLSEHDTRTVAELEAYVSDVFRLVDDDLSATLKSGQRVVRNRLGWATTYLKKARYIENAGKSGIYRITIEGRAFLASHPAAFDDKDLMASSPEVRDWVKSSRKKSKKAESNSVVVSDDSSTPQEVMEAAYASMRDALCDELLDRLFKQDPYEFEHTVATLLKAMGYGDTWGNSVQVTKKSGDGGVDGFVREDRLGFDMVYYQAKRWAADNKVGSKELNAFAGVLLGKGTNKGVFITTSSYSQDARDFVDKLGSTQHIVLIDGRRLAELMIDHGVGVSTVESFEIKAIDSDFFDGE